MAHGLWSFPGGHVRVNELIKQAATREAKEETGYDVEIIKEIAIFCKDEDMAVKHIFETKIIGGSLKCPKDEIMDAKWFTPEKIRNMKDKLRKSWILDAIAMLEKSKF